MISYSPVQNLSNGKVKKTQTLATWSHGAVSGLDIHFIKTLGKVWLFAIAVLVFFYSIIFFMNGDVARSIVEVENSNYELLSTNLELKNQNENLTSAEVVTVRAADLGLHKPLTGQVRLYRKDKHYFSYL